MISVQQVMKSYGKLQAVAGCSFDIEKSETFGLLGPNGAGKTSMINMMTGVIQPDSGTIQIGEHTDLTKPKARYMLGVAPQELAIYEEFTGAENLLFFGKLYGLQGKKLKQQVDWALQFVGLEGRKDDRSGHYSGGMKRRLNLAAALLHEPPVLFLDEPTVGVDPQSRNQLFENVEKLKKAGKTIIYTTHYMEEAQRLCDRIAIMDNGKLLALDTLEGLLKEYGGDAIVELHLQELPEDPDRLPGVLQGEHLRIETTQPLEEIAKLASEGLKFQELKVEKADLESVFLKLTGKRLRDN